MSSSDECNSDWLEPDYEEHRNEEYLRLEALGVDLISVKTYSLHKALGSVIRSNGYDDGKLTLSNVHEYRKKLNLNEREELEVEEKYHIHFVML